MLSFDNPIWFREQRSRQARKLKMPAWRRPLVFGLPLLWLGIMGVTVGIGLLIDPRHTHVRDCLSVAGVIAVYIQVAYLTCRSLIAGASTVVRERELQTLDTLLSSPLPTMQLVVGKWMVAALPLLVEVLVAAPLGLVAVMARQDQTGPYTWQLGDMVILSVGIVSAMSAVGVLLSTRAVNSGRAASQAVGVALALILGTYLAFLLCCAFDRHVEPVAAVLLVLNPYSALYSIAVGGTKIPGTEGFFANFWMWTVALYALGTWLAGALAYWRLQRRALS